MKINRHSVIVFCRPEEAFYEIVRWGEAPWWPKKSLMRFERRDKSPVTEGTFYRQRVMLPFAPSWNAQVTKMTDSSMTRAFSGGMLEGHESVGMVARPGGFEVVYEMRYRIKGFFNRLMWRVIFNKLHDQNIEMILKNLKEYLERNGQKACV